MSKDSPSAPAPPDPVATAEAQAAANIKAAFATAQINNPNITNPYGKSSTQYGVNAFFAANPGALAEFKADSGGFTALDYAKQYSADRPGMANPYSEYTPFVSQTLNPESQKILDAQQQTKLQLADLANLGVKNASAVLSTPFSFAGDKKYEQVVGPNGLTPNIAKNLMQGSMTGSGVPTSEFEKYGGYEAVKAVYDKSGGDYSGQGRGYAGQANTTIANAGKIMQGPNAANFLAGSGPDASKFMAAGGPKASDFVAAGGPSAANFMAGNAPNAANFMANRGLDTSNVAPIPINAGMTGQQAIMARLEPQIQRNRVSTETQLINQGLRPGSQAYNNAATLLGQQENDLRTQAVLQGLGLDMSANAQGYGQAVTTGQFGNQAQGQNFQQGLAAQGLTNQAQAQNFGQGNIQQQLYNQAQAQNFGQGNIQQQLYNQAQAQNFGQGTTAQNTANQAAGQNYTQNYNTTAFNNAAQQQQFAQNTQQAAFENQARQQALAEAIQQRQMPLNEISALMSGSQIQNPVFQPFTGANVGAAPIAQTMQNAYAGQMNAYNQEVASQNETQKGLFDLGSAAITYFSDKRLKSNITRIGTHPLGIGIYEYDIFGRREIGAMAQEVQEVLPEAIHIHPSGFMMVDYGRLNA